MPSFIHNPKEFWSGVMFCFFGIGALVIAQMDLEIGHAGKMGPGYFPSALAILLTLIGAVSIARSLFKKGEAIEQFTVKKCFLVLLAVLLFGLIVRGAGLVIAIFAVAMVSMYASEKFNVKHALLFSVGASVFCVLVFIKGLGLPMPIIGAWFGY